MTEEDKDHSVSDAKMDYEDKNEDYKADYQDNMDSKFIKLLVIFFISFLTKRLSFLIRYE